MPAKSPQIEAALVARLQSITVANGYATNLGPTLYHGWLAHAIAAGLPPPFLCLQTRDNTGSHRTGTAHTEHQDFMLIVAVEAKSGCTMALGDALHDLRTAVFSDPLFGGLAMDTEQDTAQFDAFENSSAYAYVALPISVQYEEHYSHG